VAFDTSARPSVDLAAPRLPWRLERLLPAWLPLPRFAIATTRLDGWVDESSGSVELTLVALMNFGWGTWEGTPLVIRSRLTTEALEAPSGVRGPPRIAGARLAPDGSCVLVALAVVPPTPSRFVNWALSLPAAATAELPTRLLIDRGGGGGGGGSGGGGGGD